MDRDLELTLRQIEGDLALARKALRRNQVVFAIVHIGSARGVAVNAARLINSGRFRPSIRQIKRIGRLTEQILALSGRLVGRNGSMHNPPDQMKQIVLYIQSSLLPIMDWLVDYAAGMRP